MKPEENKTIDVTIGDVTFRVSYSGGSYNLLLPAPEEDDWYWEYNFGDMVVNVPSGEDVSLGAYDSVEDLLNGAIQDIIGGGNLDEIISGIIGAALLTAS